MTNPTRPKRGRPRLPPEPDLTDIDRMILRIAQQYASETGKPAANGAVGHNITNDGGPFVKRAAKETRRPPNYIIARLDRMERHPRLRSLWNTYRTPVVLRFVHYLKSQGLA